MYSQHFFPPNRVIEMFPPLLLTHQRKNKKKKKENMSVILWTFSASEDLQSGDTDSC